MTPAARAGQQHVLKVHYERVGAGPVAYLDETYSIEAGRKRFYVMAAVVVLEPDRDLLRGELDTLVPDGWWHTTDQLRTEQGREQARELLKTFQVPDETCVIVDKVSVDGDDKEGDKAREAVLGRLLTAIHHAEAGSHPPVSLAVIEEHRLARKNNFDRAIRTRLIEAGAIAETMALVALSPGAEHLLWLPDLTCSAYRQKMLFNRTEFFDEIEHLAHVVELP